MSRRSPPEAAGRRLRDDESTDRIAQLGTQFRTASAWRDAHALRDNIVAGDSSRDRSASYGTTSPCARACASCDPPSSAIPATSSQRVRRGRCLASASSGGLSKARGGRIRARGRLLRPEAARLFYEQTTRRRYETGTSD